jgi:hypothetical protein
MSIISQLKSLATVLSGVNLRSVLISDAQTFETEINRLGAVVDPVISNSNVTATNVTATSISIGGVVRTSWPAAGGTASALNDVIQNGSTANLPAAATDFTINDSLGSPLLSINKATGLLLVLGNSALDPSLFYKPSSLAHAFTKTGAGTISINAGTSIMVFGKKVTFAALTAISMPTLVAGTDYAIYVCTDGTIRADSSFSAPTGYTIANSRMIGGFHYGLIAAGTTATVANGFNPIASTTHNGTTASASAIITGIATTADLIAGMNVSGTGIPLSATGQGNYILSVDSGTQITISTAATAAGSPMLTFTNTGMVWTQTLVDDIAGINKYSIWDLRFRPKSDPRGMVLVDGQLWVDIYLCSSDTATNGTSKYNTNIASGTVLPKIPAAFGGNGTVTYPTLNWWVANELARANQKRLLWESEFVTAMFGVAENRSIDAVGTTYPTALHIGGLTSKYGIEQASGTQWIWGQDSNFYAEVASPAGSWKDINSNTSAATSGRGQIYTFGVNGISRVLLGGLRTGGSISGSRASNWSAYPWSSGWNIGLRAACDHLISA